MNASLNCALTSPLWILLFSSHRTEATPLLLNTHYQRGFASLTLQIPTTAYYRREGAKA